MFKFKYNLIAFLNSAFSALAILFLYLDFNVESISSIFLFGLSYFQIVQLICQLFTEQFIYAYLSIDSKNEAHLFYSSYLLLSIIISLFVWSCAFTQIDLILNILNSGLSEVERNELKRFIIALSPYIFIFLPGTLAQAFFTAKKKIITSYLNQFLPSTALLSGFIIRKLFNLDLLFVNYFYSTLSTIAILTIIFFSRPKLYFSSRIFKKQIVPAIKESFQFRAAYNINNIGVQIILNIFLSPISPSYRSSFLYAKRAADTALQIFFGPTMRILKGNLGKARSRKDFKEVFSLINILKIYSPLIFLGVFIFSFIFIPFLKMTQFKSLDSLIYIYSTFFILNLQNTISTFSMPWAIICQRQKELKAVFLSTIIGTSFLYFSNLIFSNIWASQVLVISLFFQEFIMYLIVMNKGRKILKLLIRNSKE